jgi:hypothetical protein
MSMNLAVPLRGHRSPQCCRRLADVIAHRAGEVRLVGEAERGGHVGEARFVAIELVERPPDADAVAVLGHRHAEFADAARVWKTAGNWENGPAAMARGHVVSSRAEGPERVVTFADGRTARERLITRDDEARRIVYTVIGDTVRPDHDNAIMHVVADGEDRCRLV